MSDEDLIDLDSIGEEEPIDLDAMSEEEYGAWLRRQDGAAAVRAADELSARLVMDIFADSNSLTRLRGVAAEAEAAEGRLRAAVDDARAVGHSWAAIAGVLGVTRQAARERWTR